MEAKQQEAKAYELMEQAEKRLKSFVVPLFGSKDAKYEDAAELFQKAGNTFKVAKSWQEAGDAYKRVAECHTELGSQHEAASAYREAGMAYKKTDSDAAVLYIQRAAEIFAELGRFAQCAKHHKEIAEIYEAMERREEAMEHYQKAADFYSGEDSSASANNCLLKVASMAAEVGQLDRAISIYEVVASNALENNLLKWSVKDYFQRALLCQLAVGDESAPGKVRPAGGPCAWWSALMPGRRGALAGPREDGEVRHHGPQLHGHARVQARGRHHHAMGGRGRGGLHAGGLRL